MEGTNDTNRGAQPLPRPIQSLYFNGFQLGLSNADVYLIIQQNGQTMVRLNLSYTMAKTLGQKLIEAINLLEKESKNTIMSLDDVGQFLLKLDENKEDKSATNS